jgi:hypothetical protein
MEPCANGGWHLVEERNDGAYIGLELRPDPTVVYVV